MIDSDRHPTLIQGEVIDPVRNGLALLRIDEVMHTNTLRDSLRTPLATTVLVFSDQFLLLGIHRDRRFSTPDLSSHAGIDVPELSVAIRMLRAFLRLSIRLEAVPHVVQ